MTVYAVVWKYEGILTLHTTKEKAETEFQRLVAEKEFDASCLVVKEYEVQ